MGMNELFLDCYIKIAVLIALADGILAVKSLQKNRTTGRFLGFACIGAAVVDISYLISILKDDTCTPPSCPASILSASTSC